MAIQKKPYELSVWSEELTGEGIKTEQKLFTIGAHDMTYLGRATAIKLKTKVNGTHEITFQMPDKYFDSEKGDYVRNQFIDDLFAERKIKLHYKEKWYEFFIKSVKEDKKFKSYMKTYTGSDAFIDELSRNGYGITFDEELYNNVEEIGTFTEEILEDSVWTYNPYHNWGDFTEYTEEKLLKIPVSQFSSLQGYKLDFSTPETQSIINAFTGEERNVEMGDDAARGKHFWDQQIHETSTTNKLKSSLITIPNDGYIYVPYSCLDFCYSNGDNDVDIDDYDSAATETPQPYPVSSLSTGYALAPPSINPNYIIQFIALPAGEEIEIDEAGLIIDKEHTYFMTLKQWNEQLSTNWWYFFKDTRLVDGSAISGTYNGAAISHTFKYIQQNSNVLDTYKESLGNKVAYYEGYLSEWNKTDIIKGKKISIADRTELNISEEIDQYVTIYNTSPTNFIGQYTNEDWTDDYANYKVCSKLATRQIVPQLARNYVQNGTDIKSTDGWESMSYVSESNDLSYAYAEIPTTKVSSGSIALRYSYDMDNKNVLDEPTVEKGLILYTPPNLFLGYTFNATINSTTRRYIRTYEGDFYLVNGTYEGAPLFTKTWYAPSVTEQLEAAYKENSKNEYYIYPNNEGDIVYYTQAYQQPLPYTEHKFELTLSQRSFINFGPVGQEKKIEKGKIYCLGLNIMMESSSYNICIGEGNIISSAEYELNASKTLKFIGADFGFNAAMTSSYGSNIEEGKQESYMNRFHSGYLLFKSDYTIEHPYVVIQTGGHFVIAELYLFEAYTKGIDQFQDGYYRYSGRDLLQNGDEWVSPSSSSWSGNSGLKILTGFDKESMRQQIIFEDDIMPGDTYEYQQYFIQRLKTSDGTTYDTMGQKEFITTGPNKISTNKLPLSAAEYTEDDYEIQTNYIDLNKCSYYISGATATECDCKYGGTANKICYYQKYGYCPYRFQTEKHCRRIRTLKGEKSNRFNLTQELSKVFKCYPVYYMEHDNLGRIKTDSNGVMQKEIFYITEKGQNRQLGFRYEKNLSNISRTIKSDKIVSKLYVQDVDSDISKTGLCSIKTAEDNPTKDSFIIDLSYYTTKGMLDKDTIEEDLYGITAGNKTLKQGYLKTLGYYNTEYDRLSNQIINLEDASYMELEANLTVNIEAIETAQKQLRKYQAQMERYKALEKDGEPVQAYQNYLLKYAEQEAILKQLATDTFQTNGTFDIQVDYTKVTLNGSTLTTTNVIKWISALDMNKVKKYWIEGHEYMKGILGQFNKEFKQIQEWKKQRAKYLQNINSISSAFFKKYEPYLKEGTWTDSNYLADNAYYHGALEVAAEGAIPSVDYTISIVDIAALPEFEDYEVEIADTTFVEDMGMFGINKHTGLPNRLKVLISEITEELDTPSKNSIKVQNYTTQFEDLFQQVTATVQSLTFNENIYRRSSNFTSLQNVKQESLQGTLDTNKLTLLNTQENNIQLDSAGQRGSDINNHANQYDLNGQGLQFSNNGGESWNTGVGPSGINADYIKVGTLDAGKIRIADSGYIYFAWDKDGIAAYRDPQSATTTTDNVNDYALFNKYGLSLIKDGNIKLRAGYEFTGTSGKANSESSCGEKVGFYLYDNEGQLLFETSSDNERSAKLRLRGEIFATDSGFTGDSDNGAIGVYVNNQSEHGDPQGKQIDGLRLFSAVYLNKDNEQDAKVQNVLSVLRDKVYIGGEVYKIKNADGDLQKLIEVTNLPDSIAIQNYGIQLDARTGEMIMDFDSLKNRDDNKSLANYIASQQYNIQTTRMRNQGFPSYGTWVDDNYSSHQSNYISYMNDNSIVYGEDYNLLLDKVADLYRFLSKYYFLTSPNIES